jgi:amino acid adenylation domain-containing protein
MTPQRVRGLHAGFVASAAAVPEKPALEVDGKVVTYDELFRLSSSIAATLATAEPTKDPPLTAVFAHRSVSAFAGVLGSLLRGHGYVPLNRTFPPERTRQMLERSGCRSIIVDASSAEQLDEVLAEHSEPVLLLFPEEDDTRPLASRWPMHRVIGRRDFQSGANWEVPSPLADDVAYLLFTSGSTGTPKGVAVAHRNVTWFVDTIVERYGITESDRLSQTFDMTFDLSVFDMFVAWAGGACVCCLSRKSLVAPARFIRDSRLTVWFSVPSTAVFMKKLGLLKPDNYPTLRWSLFCGEPLPVEVARAWADAAPRSVVENLYGPTELTIACTAYRWNPETSPKEAEQAIVPIGDPLRGMDVLVAGDTLEEVGPGDDGELLLAGPQVTLGYWHDPELTAKSFVTPPGCEVVYYRTGDRVRRPVGDEPLVYLGRIDHQIKIRGHRIELGEIEAAVREESGVDAVIAVGWPKSETGADGIAVFLGNAGVNIPDLKQKLERRLPPYMIPRIFHAIEELPLNANGKFDRNALLGMLEEKETISREHLA